MPTPPLSHEAMQEAVDAIRKHGSQPATATALALCMMAS